MNRTAHVLFAIWLVVAAFLVYLLNGLFSSRESAEQRVRDRAVSYAHVVEQHASAAFERANNALRGISDHVRPVDLNGNLTDARRSEIRELLVNQRERAAGVIGTFITDASGNIVSHSQGLSQIVSLGDREYFLSLKRKAPGTPVISEAVYGRVTKRWGVQMARRIDWPDGRFGGLVGATLGLSENFADFYATLSLGTNCTVSLRDADNRLLVRFPFVDETRLSKQILTPGLAERISGGDIEGAIISASTLDSVERLYGFRKLTGYPIYAVVGLSLDDALSGWRRERDAVGFGALFVVLTGAFVTIGLLQRERANELLRDNEQRLNLASDAGEVGVWDLDLLTDQAWRSLRHEQIFGYESLQQRWGREIFLSHVVPEDREAVKRQFEEAYDSGHLVMECRILRKDGSLRWIAAKGQVFRDRQGKAVRMTGVITDITERREMEAQIRALNEDLEHRVVERTAELKKSHAELQALTAVQESIQEEERKRIARELHDELAQKLTVLKLQLQALVSTLPAPEPGLTRQIDDMNLLLTDTMRAVGQIAANLRSVVLDKLGLVTALRDLVDEFSQRTGIDCEFSVHPADLSVDSRLAMPLYRMVQESLTNVARHARATEVVVSLYGDPAGKIVLNVDDNGTGMADDGRHARKSFGLIGMRERAAILGGEMKIHSEPGAGTSIEIVIPLGTDQPHTGSAEPTQ